MKDGDVLPALLAWVAVLGGAVALILADPFPIRLTLVTPARVHATVLAAQTLFVLFAWPFLLAPARERVPLRAAALVLLGLPFALLGANLSGEGAGALLRGQLFVFALAAFVAALGPAGRSPAYVLVAALLAAGLPLAAFTLAEFGGRDLGWLRFASPLWSAVDASGGAALIGTGLAAAGAVVLGLRERPA